MNGDKQILREHDLTISGKSKILGSDPLSCPQYEDSHAVIVQNSTDLLHGPGVSHAEILMVVDGPDKRSMSDEDGSVGSKKIFVMVEQKDTLKLISAGSDQRKPTRRDGFTDGRPTPSSI
ncbi:hypothetical protein ACOSQ3_007535 [Xanthoceras sorbifolium]